MPSPLNPTLFGRLREEFGHVSVSHEGVSVALVHAPDVLSGKMRVQVVSAGEYYRVNCPYCTDGRKRLWINHMWGVPDEVTGSKNLWLAICYNEDCMSRVGRSYELYDRVYAFKNANMRGQPIVILQGEKEEVALREVAMPGITLRLDRVPETDDVCTYLRNRGLDPGYLGRTFNVSYCLDATSNYPMAQGRIIIPVYMRGLLVGWQCRYVGDVDWKARGIPKYYNRPNMARRLMLYNFDTAKKHPYVVVTEGPMDAWSVGESAVAMFGKHPSVRQLTMLCENWDKAIIVLLDGDAWDDAVEITERLRQESYKGTVIPVRLPQDSDPGGLDRTYIWELIDAECRKIGLDLATMQREDNASNSSNRLPYWSPAGDGSRGRNVGPQRPVPEYSFDVPRDAPAGS
jgi:hypothetical protein